jgi:hypothetical protein
MGKGEAVMARQSDLFSINNGVLKDFIPIRIHDRGRFDEAQKKWVPVDKIIVMMLSDILYIPVWEKGVKTGEFKKHFIKPMRYIPCAGSPDAPRMSGEADKAFSGTFIEADVDGEKMVVLTKRENGSNNPTERWVLVREGWRPHMTHRTYLPSVVDEIKKGMRIGKPGSFLLGNSSALASSSSEASDEKEEAGGRVSGSQKIDAVVDGQVVHFALYSVCKGESVIGQTRNGVMWQYHNKDGDIRAASESEAEAMRVVYNFKEQERRERAKDARVARLRAEKEKARADRLKTQEALAADAAKAAESVQILEDQVVAAPSEEVVAA